MLYLAIPSHNEAATIGVLLWRLRSVLAEFPREYEVVVYDDASDDVTSEVLEPYTKVLPLTVLRGERTVGYAGAVDALVRYVSRQTRYPRRDAMLLLQGDFTDPPALVPEFAKRFEGGADMVIGERSRSSDTPVSVRRLLRVTPWVTRPFVRVEGVRDITSSFRLVRISVLRDLIRAAGDAPVCVGDELTANADFLLRTVPLARRVETLAVEPTFGVRTRETRRITMRDGLALARWAWRSRGRRVAPSTAPELPADSNRSQRNESRADSRTDSRNDVRPDTPTPPRTEVRVETKHEPRLDIRAHVRGESRPNPRNDARREARRDARNEARTEPRKRFEPREEEIRDYGNDGIYNPNPEPRPAPVVETRTPDPEAIENSLQPAERPTEERRAKRPRPKRRKRSQRGDQNVAADGAETDATSSDDDNENRSHASAPIEQGADTLSSEITLANSDNAESSDEGSDLDRAKRPRKKRRKRGSRRNRNADGTPSESDDVTASESGDTTTRGEFRRNENHSDDTDSNTDESNESGDDNEGGESSQSADETVPRARRRGRRGRRGGARRNRATSNDGSSNDGSSNDGSSSDGSSSDVSSGEFSSEVSSAPASESSHNIHRSDADNAST